MNVERQRRIFVQLWPNSIHLALWRNYGFSHSFRDFSKSNAFNEKLIKMMFTLHKIFFRMSIFSSSRTLRMLFDLHLKMTRLDFQLNYYCHDTGHSFEPIFTKFPWLAWVLALVNPFFFFFFLINNRSNRSTNMGEDVPPKLVF